MQSRENIKKQQKQTNEKKTHKETALKTLGTGKKWRKRKKGKEKEKEKEQERRKGEECHREF